jgi:hypothetical protein
VSGHRIEEAPRPVNSIINIMWNGLILSNRWDLMAIYWTLLSPRYIMRAALGQGTSDFLTLGTASGPGMERFGEAAVEGLVLWIAVLAVLLAIAGYVIGKIRPKPVQKEPRAGQWLTKFGELHTRGGLSDEEYRTIKTTLEAQLPGEVNDNRKNS